MGKEKPYSLIPNHRNSGEQFIVGTHASNIRIEGVSLQKMKDEEHVIVCFNKTLYRVERNYCLTRKERLAVIQCKQHCLKKLYGQPFSVPLNHASLSEFLT